MTSSPSPDPAPDAPGRPATDPRALDQRLDAIARQPFRAKFHLRGRDRATAELKGPATIRWHAYDLIARRLAPAEPYKDGKQTPYRGHPVFVAQHATATCCRGCLRRWHGVPKGRELTRAEHIYVVDVICRWIAREMTSGTFSGQDPCRADPDHEIS
ncbi:DUF4186 domain-containing protein [Streptomyces echinatus]|uniref:DUF4186 domain-containing protein n=1 Tax=Streptomyces echinatus TaxID=67293 RepID=A0A7W9PVS1_9ACTN|nr:DUF4186 domain-containing protein [Streptomyces echinatus]MBB5928167.1 hypothetical protein [Streptomyces echinatus]